MRELGEEFPECHDPREVPRRALSVEAPALAETFLPGVAWEWQWDAANMDAVPDSVLRDASRVKIAVIDSGADLGAPNPEAGAKQLIEGLRMVQAAG